MLGGYLGAGKTTLLNELLASSGDQRLVVVVNDFGSVNVDAELVRSRSEDTLELSNGCVCCSLADGMAVVMERIRGIDPPPDRVLVEVSGVGDPATVAGWGDHPGFRRSAVLVCADVLGIRTHARDKWVADTVLHQLAGADLVLLTKTDLADAGQVEEVVGWLAEHAPRATVVHDRRTVRDLLDGPGADTPPDVGRPGPAHDAVHSTWTVQGATPVPLEALEALLREVVVPVVRVKGVVATHADQGVRRTLVNVAGDQQEITDDGPWAGGDDRDSYDASRLVVIASGPEAATPELVTRLQDLLGGEGR